VRSRSVWRRRASANASDVAPNANLLLFAAGIAGIGYAAITLITALTLTFRQPDAGAASAWRGLAIRARGCRIATIGLMMLGFAFVF
jgi:urease accessory protein